MTSKKVLLMILDGWGIAKNKEVSAVDLAKTPCIDTLTKMYPNTTLRTDGLNVGLPDGQMGNSEVGHMNLGAGRIVYQDLAKINVAIDKDILKNESVLIDAFNYAKQNQKNVHFLGLVSDGGVHSHINHLIGLLKAAKYHNVNNVFVHAFTDGRDVDPKSGAKHIADLQTEMKMYGGQLASIIGRYYAMDRDNRWERIKKAYDLLIHGVGCPTPDAVAEIHNAYAQNITDEFLEPMVMVNESGVPITTIQPDDVVIFFNFRTDRGRELTEVLSQNDLHEWNMYKLPLYFVTMTNYDDQFKNIKVIYNKDNLTNTLGETVANAGKSQIRIAETEKYPHVTFFFSGGREAPFEGERRILCPSPKVATYDMAPEMSAHAITNAIIPEIAAKSADFICLNFANGDMVGHTGNLHAAISACETVDQCVQEIIAQALQNDYATIILADHGNCEVMQNADGSMHTAHTTNPVPMIVVGLDKIKLTEGVLADIAPTILDIMGIEKPNQMTGKSLINYK